MSNTNTNNAVAVRSNNAGISIAERLAATPKTTPVEAAFDAGAELARLRAENAALKAKAASNTSGPKSLSVKVAVKGGISIYGTGRYPITAYAFNMLKVMSPENVKATHELMAGSFGSLSFKTVEQRDTAVATLRERGFTVSDTDIASAKVTADAE